MAAARRCGDHRFMTSQSPSRDERHHMHGSDLPWQVAATGASQPFYRTQPTAWQRLLAAVRPSHLLAIAALLVALGLLAAFQHVVAGVVSQGVVARKAALADVSWRASTRRAN
jgi:hypothetical protein